MEDSEIEEVLDKAKNLINWINFVKDFALKDAMRGKRYEHYKLVEGRFNRKYSDDDAVIKSVKDAGYNPFEEKLLPATAM